MTPTVVRVSEQNSLDRGNNVVKAIVLTYYVGKQGPFTLVTNQVDIASGAAMRAMQSFADSLAVLGGILN